MTTAAAEIITLLDKGRGQKLHWFPDDVSVSDLAAVLTGMANSDGGNILIGVAPRSSQVTGIRDAEYLTDIVFQAALLIDPSLVLPIPRILEIQDKQVLSVVVAQGLPHAFNLEGRYLVRRGVRTEPLPPPELRALMIKRGSVQFEAQVPEDASLNDLDFDQIAAYKEALDLPPDEPLEDLLSRRGCMKECDGEMKPTYAGLLLFGLHPQQWAPSATILAARFSGLAFSDQFVKQEIRGTLPQQLRQAETFVRDQLRRVVRLVGLTREETPEYPLEAVRELLVNAVAHRDYNQGGDSIHLHIFADRLEVHSPGDLPGPVTLENLLEARFSRNPVIAQVLSDLGYVERLGYGLNRVLTVMRQNNLPEPKFEEVGGAFRVMIFNSIGEIHPERIPNGEVELKDAIVSPDISRYSDHELNPRQELALGFLATRKRLTNRDYQGLCPDVSSETLRRDLADLVNKGVILKMGTKRGTYYILK
ncbi:MAG: putative DNA binding domain-containing protein [Anaerolineales bacterium]|nr:putative DNA binding domain-containing protein [Chloroflexota bacterium]MBL6981786.1 putative DNA binding domain-containing protein [Anaerolineales bacterium]